MILGERINERMIAEGLSQAELARRVGVSQPTIFKLIHENKSGSRHLHRIAWELSTTAAYLTGATDDPIGEEPEDRLTSQEREWVELLRALETKDRQAALTLVRTIAHSAGSPAVHEKQQDCQAATSDGATTAQVTGFWDARLDITNPLSGSHSTSEGSSAVGDASGRR